MRLTLTRSGGFLGAALPTVVVDTATLSPTQQAQVEDLVRGADFFALPHMLKSERSGSDRFQYELQIEDTGGRSHRVRFGEEVATESLLDLTRAIREIGRG